ELPNEHPIKRRALRHFRTDACIACYPYQEGSNYEFEQYYRQLKVFGPKVSQATAEAFENHERSQHRYRSAQILLLTTAFIRPPKNVAELLKALASTGEAPVPYNPDHHPELTYHELIALKNEADKYIKEKFDEYQKKNNSKGKRSAQASGSKTTFFSSTSHTDQDFYTIENLEEEGSQDSENTVKQVKNPLPTPEEGTEADDQEEVELDNEQEQDEEDEQILVVQDEQEQEVELEPEPEENPVIQAQPVPQVQPEPNLQPNPNPAPPSWLAQLEGAMALHPTIWDLFKADFFNNETKEEALTIAERWIQKPGESIDMYIAVLRKIWQECNPNEMTDYHKLKNFLSGLTPAIRMSVKQTMPADLNAAITTAKAHYRAMKEEMQPEPSMATNEVNEALTAENKELKERLQRLEKKEQNQQNQWRRPERDPISHHEKEVKIKFAVSAVNIKTITTNDPGILILILVTGDRDYKLLVEMALENNWIVQTWFWTTGISGKLRMKTHFYSLDNCYQSFAYGQGPDPTGEMKVLEVTDENIIKCQEDENLIEMV
ncbi:4823_t:CDS:2, partial [Paraglomus occultum]